MAYAHWDPNSMMLVNISDNPKAGSVYGGTIDTGGGATVNKAALKYNLGELTIGIL